VVVAGILFCGGLEFETGVEVDLGEPPLVAAAVTAALFTPLASPTRDERRALARLFAVACETARRRRSGTARFPTARPFAVCLTAFPFLWLVVADLVTALR
jgi:hypothetical protein